MCVNVCMCVPINATQSGRERGREREKERLGESEWVFCRAVGWWGWSTSPISQTSIANVEP